MSTPPRTIDNLGVETSVRWAKDQTLLGTAPLKEGSTITQLTQISVPFPSYLSEFELLFGNLNKELPWALFLAPQGYETQKKKLFTIQIVPSLGTEEKFEMQMNRVQEKDEQEKKREQKEEDLPWEENQEKEEEEKEKKIILNLMNSLHMLNRFLIDINSRRIQYQKG